MKKNMVEMLKGKIMMRKIIGENKSMEAEEEEIIDLDQIQMIQVNQVHLIEEAEREKREKKRGVLIMVPIILLI